ncbi:MAG: FAD-binding oxidoreductase [Hyphomicrobiales bacterium]
MRLYHSSAFDFSKHVDSYWQASAPPLGLDLAPLEGRRTADVAIIGSGFVGLHAAHRLTSAHGLSTAVLDAADVGWGASGRNGGFCCAGSSKLSFDEMAARYGQTAATAFQRAQVASVAHVGAFLDEHEIEADRSGEGEYQLAHRERVLPELRTEQQVLGEAYNVRMHVLDREDLRRHGMHSPAFHGGLFSPVGFGLHPLKYVRGLARAAAKAGVTIYPRSAVTAWRSERGQHVLATDRGEVQARSVLLATNGYTDERLPPWIGGRLLPALSRIIVTRPLTDAEIAAQGWSSHNMAYDTRRLVHYFRLLPDKRFLFGGRGGTDASPEGLAAITRTLRRQFDEMFPAWAKVETEFTWGGFVCLTASLVPYIGPIDGMETAFAAVAWHGNGVAMGSYAGRLVADRIAGGTDAQNEIPVVMRGPLRKFPMPQLRVPYLKGAYALYGFTDERP